MEIDLGRLLDALPGLVWTALADGRVDYVGRRWLEYTGLAPELALGAGWTAAMHPDDAPRVRAACAQIIASGAPGEFEARLRRRDGEHRWFQFRLGPMPEPSGETLRWCGVGLDIDERVHAEAAVRERQVLLERILDGLPANAVMFSPTGELTYRNRQMLEYIGATVDDVQPFGQRFHPDEREALLAEWSTSARLGRPFDRATRIRRADGAYRWHRTMIVPLHNAAGDIELWYGLATDIDETKRAEEKLAAEKRLLELVAKGGSLRQTLEALCLQVEELALGSRCAIFVIDTANGTFCVGAAPNLSAEYRATFDGRPIDPADAPSALAVDLKAPVIVVDLQTDPRWAGSPLPGRLIEHGLRSCWAMPILSGAGNVLGVFAAYHPEAQEPTPDEHELIERFAHIAGIAIERDQAVSALKASEAELRRANRYLTEAQRLSKTGSFTWDVEADEHDWSEQERRIWEFDPTTRIDMPMILSAVHPDDMPLVETVIGEATQGSAGFELVFRIITASGALKHLHCVGHRVEQILDRPVFLGAIQDITERKAAEDALARARTQLAHVARVTTLSALTASIAHEVNQPLAGIITNASTCLRMLAAAPPNIEGARATAQRTIRDGNRASEVIQRLRALFARRSSAFEPVDLNSAADEVLTLCSSDLQAAKVTVRPEFARDLPPVSGDRVQLQQVILNMVSNAADAMRRVNDRPRCLTIRTWREAADKVVLSVRDSGVGLDPEHFERLFDAFYTTKAEGMGVGLAISRSIIEAHEGRLWAEPNENGPGATFAFAIPLNTVGETGSTPSVA